MSLNRNYNPSRSRARGTRGLFVFLPSFALLLTGCAELQTLRDRTALQEKEIARLRQENAEFQQAYYKTNEQRTSESQALKEQVELLRRELEKAKNLKTDRERELEEMLRKQGLEADAVRVQSQTQIERYSEDLTALNEAVARYEQETLALRNRTAELEATINQDQKTIEKLQTQIADLSTAGQSLEKVRAETEAKLRSAEKDVTARTQELAEANAQLAQANQEIEGLKAAQTDAANASEAMTALQAENEKLKSEIAALQEKVNSESGPNLANDPTLIEASRQLKARLAEIPDGNHINVQLEKRGLRVIVPSDYAFNRGTVLLSDAAKPVLNEIAAVLLASAPNRRIRVEGHTDDQPMIDLPFADNWGLGAARADRVRQHLVTEARMDPAALELVTRSHFEPIAKNTTPEGRAQNRRVEIVVTNPL